MDIDNLGVVEAEILQAPETRFVIYLFIFLRLVIKLKILRNTSNMKNASVKKDLSRGNWGLKELLL